MIEHVCTPVVNLYVHLPSTTDTYTAIQQDRLFWSCFLVLSLSVWNLLPACSSDQQPSRLVIITISGMQH